MGQLKQMRLEQSQDRDLGQRVSHYLDNQHFPSFRKLAVEVQQGQVTISGTVCSFYERQVAVSACQHVAGVNKLIDCISVE